MPFCQACGTSVNPDARFCTTCGNPANLTVTSSPSVVTASAAVAPPIETYSAAPNVELPRTPASVVLGAQTSDKAIRARRPRGVTILAVLMFVGVIPAVSLGFFLFSYVTTVRTESAIPLMNFFMEIFPLLATSQHEMVSEVSAGAATMFVIAAIFAVVGYGLWTLRKWGRILAIVCSALTVLHAMGMILTSSGTLLWHLLSIGINIWIIMYLLKPHVKQAFGA